MKQTLAILAIVSVAAGAMAMSTFGPVFNAKYSPAKDSALGKAACGVCHAGAKGGALNKYGKDLQKAMKAAKSTKLTAAILSAVEGLDSNGNGTKNVDEIKAGKLPG